MRPIVTRGNNSVLETRASRVTKFNEYLQTLVGDMFETMYAANGVGLAAPQIGVSLQVAVIDLSWRGDGSRIVLVNPKIMHWDGEQIDVEGCLSIPGWIIAKKRFESTTVRARDVNGKAFTLTGTGLLARAIQHEWDHLQGVLLYADRPISKPQEFRAG